MISGHPSGLRLLAIAFDAILAIFFFRLYYPWPYNLHLLAGAWLIIALTLAIMVALAVFAAGRITFTVCDLTRWSAQRTIRWWRSA